MFNFESLKRIQVEITNKCQASCPMCLRNIHGGIDNPSLKINEWQVKDFIAVFNKEVLAQVEHINFCGDFGDPILNNDLIEMCQYLKDNSNIMISINTNGSVRNVDWWRLLAKSLPSNHRVEFALDGLRDTHSLYRIGTDFNNIIRNATAFIDAGGIAHWMFIKFKHNEHQVDTAHSLSDSLGFKRFTVKTSKRFGKEFPVLDKNGNITHYIEQSTTSDIKHINFIDLKDYKKWESTISCFTVEEKELYIDAHGHLMPCCLIGSCLYSNYDIGLYKKYNVADDTSIVSIANEIKYQVFDLINELGGLDSLDSHVYSIKDILNNPVWQELVQQKWATNSSPVCSVLCGSNSPYIKIKEQINRAS